MEVKSINEKSHSLPVVIVADLIAGRPVDDQAPKDVTADAAFAAANAFFNELGVTDRASYLSHRNETKAGLREMAGEIRRLKAKFRYLDGNDSAYYPVARELSDARRRFRELHDTRRLGKAWSGVVRRRSLEQVKELAS